MSLNTLRTNLYGNNLWKFGMWAVVVFLVILTITSLGANLGSGRGRSEQNAPVNDVVAVINGMNIMRTEYDKVQQNVRDQAQRSIDPAESADLHASVLMRLAMMKLQVAEAKKAGVTVTQADLDKAREEFVTNNRLRERLSLKLTASLAEVDDALAKANGHHIKDILPDAELTEGLLVDKYQKDLDNKIVVSELDARESFKQYHTRHILIDHKTRSDEQAKSQAEKVLEKAKAPGADFAALAKQYSDDAGTKTKGGDDGWIEESTPYVAEFKKAAFALKPGEVTPELVKSDSFGYFIIKMEGSRDHAPKDFDKDKTKYINDIQSRRRQDAQMERMQALQTEAKKIDIKDPLLRADQAIADAHTADPTARDAKFKAALADYALALKGAKYNSDKGAIYGQMGMAYQALKQIPEATDAFTKAIAATSSPMVEVALASIYIDQKSNDKAIDLLQKASKQAWDNPQVHQQILSAYQKIGRKDLQTEEMAWQADYQKKQEARQAEMMKQFQEQNPQAAPAGGAPGGQPNISVAPSGDGAQPNIKVVPSGGGAPPNVHIVPSGGAAPAPASGGTPVGEFKVTVPKEGGKPIVTPMPAPATTPAPSKP
jgi:peptidyl-prolyl cis-trans isomerase C